MDSLLKDILLKDSLLKDMKEIEDRYNEILATWAAEDERNKRLERKRVRQNREEIASRRSLKDEKVQERKRVRQNRQAAED